MSADADAETTDAEVISASLSDVSAFGQVFDRHGADVLRFLVRRVGPDTAEDLLADVFRIAFETRGRFDQTRASARPWLFGIGANLLRHHWRSEERRLRAVGELVASTASRHVPSSEDAAGADALGTALVQRLDELPDTQREVLLMYAFEDLTYEDIAVALGLPIGTVRSRLSRARQRLRDLLADEFDDRAATDLEANQ